MNSFRQLTQPVKITTTLVILALCIAYLVYAMASSPQFGLLTFDAIHSYLPFANKLLAEPLLFWKDTAAITVAPGGYVYMALVGAEPDRIFILNIIIAVLSLLLVFDLCRRLGGMTAGIAGAILYSFSPLLIEVIVPVLNEPPYLFFTILWLWGSVLASDKPGKNWPIVIAGLALLCSILTRAIYFYWLFPAIVTCLLIYFFAKKADLKKLCLRILAIHLIAATGAGAYTLHNWYTHDTAMIATGSGSALYFGSNSVTLGYEPHYLEMAHDEWMVTDRVNSHLTPHNDRRLAWAAKHMLKDMPVEHLIELYVNKLGAILFFSQANLSHKTFNDRSFRIFLLVLAAIGFFYNRKKLLAIMILFVFLYVTAIHVPAMYNPRYSIGALDLPLTLLAALGIAHLVSRQSSKKIIAGTFCILLICMAAGTLHQRYGAPLMPQIDKGITLLALKAPLEDIEYRGFSGNPLVEPAIFLDQSASLRWKNISNKKQDGTPIVSINILEMDPLCKKLNLTYTDQDKNSWEKSFSLKKSKAPINIVIGSSNLDDRDKRHNQLDIEFRCPINSTLKIGGIALHVSQTGLHYNEQLPIDLK
jgi:hypothetical protein